MNSPTQSDGHRFTGKRFEAALLIVMIAVPLVVATSSCLTGRQTFAFRDSAEYYFPLFRWTTDQWSQGRVPLWNPQDNCGVPVLAEATSSVFYPAQLLFVIPAGYALKFNLYVLSHVALAAVGAFFLARHFGATRHGSALAAIAYSAGGSVLFQCMNVVFLVGAAWLPLGFLAADRLIDRPGVRRTAALAAVLAMMILGGDPQMAYHACLAAALLVVLRFFHQRRTSRDAGDQRRREPRWRWVAGAAALAAMLAAVQVGPSSQWMRRGNRAAFDRPRSLYEVPEYIGRFNQDPPSDQPYADLMAGLAGPPQRGTHHEQIYHFSIGPWRCVEFLWPNVAGRLIPENRRWFSLIPAEGRVWSPTLYIGLLPFVLALGTWSVRRQASLPVRWLSWCTALAIVASFGWFGIGWLIGELSAAFSGAPIRDAPIGAPTGGLYWMMVVALPLYAKFRYPAKLMVVVALGLSQLAALEWDRHVAGRRVARWMIGLAVVSTLACCAVWMNGQAFAAWFSRSPADSVLGPVQGSGAAGDLGMAFAHTAAVALIVAIVFWRVTSVRLRSATLVLITASELALAHHALLPKIDVARLEQESRVERTIAEATDESNMVRVYRDPSRSWVPVKWRESSSSQRLNEIVDWDRDTLYPRHHQSRRMSSIDVNATQQEFIYHQYLALARGFGVGSAHHGTVLGAAGAEYWILPQSVTWVGREPVAVIDLAEPVSVWHEPDARPRAWVVHQTITQPDLDRRDPGATSRGLSQVFLNGSRPRDLSVAAVVHDERAGTLDGIPAADDAGETCVVTDESPNAVSLDVTLARPGLVVLADLYYPGWTARVTDLSTGRTRGERIWRTNGWMRGVSLDAGRYRIRYAFHPKSFYAGLAISLLALGATVVGSMRRPR